MKSLFTNLRFPAATGLLLVFPLTILELINKQNLKEGFPFALFGILWFLPVLCILTVMPIVRDVRSGNRLMVHPVLLLIRILLVALLVWIWMGIVMDQMPCFLGVPNCD